MFNLNTKTIRLKIDWFFLVTGLSRHKRNCPRRWGIAAWLYHADRCSLLSQSREQGVSFSPHSPLVVGG